jgi:hypothetical protein
MPELSLVFQSELLESRDPPDAPIPLEPLDRLRPLLPLLPLLLLPAMMSSSA